MLHRFHEIGGKILLVHETKERDVCIEARDDSVRAIFSAVSQHDAAGSTILYEDAGNGRIDFDFCAAFFGGSRNGIGQGAHAAAHISPNAAHSIALPHHVMEQHISCARHGRSRERPDNGIGRDRRFHFFGLEPTIENGISGAGEDFDRLLAIVAELTEAPRSFGELKQVVRRQ